MSQHTDQIREVLDHEDFNNIDEFPQIAEEENFTTEINDTTLNEAIADFEQITELLDTAIKENIISAYANNQLENIKDRLTNVRNQATNIEHKNTRRNNPGRDFIKQVDNLRSYVIGELSLDLRVGDHLDFAENLNDLKEIREEQQKSRHALEKAEETHEQIESIHENISNREDTIDKIVDSAKDSQESLETIENKVSSKLQNVKNDSETINEHYEEVLKKTEQINNREDRLKENISEIEERSEQLSQQQEDINEIKDRIETLLNGAVAASLDRNFSARKEELERGAKIWAGSTFVAIIALIVGAYFIFETITQSGGSVLGQYLV